MAAKERHKQKVKQRIQDRLNGILLQEEALHSLIRDYVRQAQTKAEELLATEDTGYFMVRYGSVEQLLDKVNNTCELLSTTAEDMIENSESDVTIQPNVTMSSFNDAVRTNKPLETSAGETHFYRHTDPKTSTPDKSGAPQQAEAVGNDHHEDLQEKNTILNSDQKASTLDKQEKLKKDEEIEKELKESEKHHEVTADRKNLHQQNSDDNFEITLDAQTWTKQTGTCLDSGAKPKHSNSIIPSPVKKSIATYIRTDEEFRNRNDSEHVTKAEISDTYRNTSILSDKGNDSVLVAEKFDENGIPSSKLRYDSTYMDVEKSVLNMREIEKFQPVKASSKTSLYMSDSSFHTLDGDTDCSDRAQSSQSLQNSSQDVGNKFYNHNKKNRSDSTSSREEGTTEALLLEQSSLPCGKITPVVVSEIATPWCFCVQTNAAQVNHLMEQICTYMSVHGVHEEPLLHPEKGHMCLARFSKDMTFYRAYIMHCHEASKEVEVLYVDYGNRERVKNIHLRKLPERFYALPMQAICCSLAEVMPNNKYMSWTEDETLVFKQYVMNQHLNCVQACKCSNPEVPVIVRLLGSYPVPSVAGGHVVLNQLSIGDVLVNRGSAKYVNTVDQVGLLEKFGDGRKESLILNKSSSHNKVVEIEDGKSVSSIDHNVGKQTKTGKELSEVDKEESTKTYKTGIKDTKKTRNIKKNDQYSVNEKENSDKNKKSKHSADKYGKNCEKNKTGDSSLTTSSKDNSKDITERSYKKHKYHTDMGDGTETTSCIQSSNSQNYIKKEQVTTEDRENTSLTNNKETVRHNEVTNVKECQDAKSKPFSTDEKGKETSMEVQGHGNSKVVTEKIAEKIGIADCETVSSAGTTDMDSERSTDTGFQSTEVTFDLQLNPKGEEVMLAHVQSPTHFYVHMLQVGQTLHLLMKSLNKHFEKMNRRKLTRLSQTFVPFVNKLCCAQFLQDNNFYRAVILNIRSDNEIGVGKVHVHYIDFGDDEWLPKRRLFPLPPHYASVPPLAIKCKLAYVRPANTNDSVRADGDDFKWSDSATRAFVDLMGFEKTLHMLVVEGNLTSDCKGELVGGNEETLGVYLVDTNGTEEVCANMDLIRQNYAVLDVPDVWNVNDKDPHDEMALMDWNPMEADFLSKRNSYKVDIEDAEMATVGYKSQDHKGICRYFSKGAHCWRGDNCPFRHVRTDSAVPLGREEVYCTDNQMEALPGVNSWVAAEVITILTPGHFYILLPMGNKSLDGACDDSAQDENANIQCNESLDDLLTALNVEYNKKSPNERTLQLKAPGEIVAARYSQDKQWYRARVIQVTEERVKVFFLDFGNTEWLPDDEIAEIMPEFLHLPFQAFECFLCGVEPIGDENWTTESKNVFRSLVDGKTLVAHIRSRSWNGCLSVDLYDTSETDDINIAEKLIENNHAVRCSFLTDSSCNGSISGQSQRTNSERSEIIMVPG